MSAKMVKPSAPRLIPTPRFARGGPDKVHAAVYPPFRMFQDTPSAQIQPSNFVLVEQPCFPLRNIPSTNGNRKAYRIKGDLLQMHESYAERIEVLERRQRQFLTMNGVLLLLLLFLIFEPVLRVKAQQKPEVKPLTVSEVSVVDSRGVVRVRISGDLPDAVVIDGKAKSRGQRAAGILLYDGTGQERSGYVTFEPSGNVGLTLDTRKAQVASFIAGPESAAAMRLFSADSAVELRSDEDGPSLHAVRRKQVVFHEPPVENPESTAMCKALRDARKQTSMVQLMDACRARTAEAACQACLAK